MDPKTLVDTLMAARLDRREVNRTLASLGLAAVTVPMLSRPGRAQAGGIVVFEWAGYEDPGLHPAYVEKYGGSPEYSFFGEEEEALQKLRSGYTCDISHPCSGSTRRWKDAGQLKPLDVARIEHWDKIFPEFMKIKGVYVDDTPYMMPFDWGNSSLLYRSDLVEIEEESWSLLLDPRYKGRLSMSDSVDSMFSVAALIAGIADPFNLTDDEIATCKGIAKQIHDNLRFYWSDVSEIEQALASGEIVAAYSWNESMLKLSQQGLAVKYMNPKEGMLTWVCGMVHITTGKGDEQAVYDYLNALNSTEAGKYLIETFGYGHGNRKSFDLVPAEQLQALGLADLDGMMASTVFYDEIPAETREKMIAAFDEIKAGT